MACVISVMATLTQGSEIFGTAIFGSMVKVCYCKDNLNHLALFVLLHRMVLTPAEFTAVICPL